VRNTSGVRCASALSLTCLDMAGGVHSGSGAAGQGRRQYCGKVELQYSTVYWEGGGYQYRLLVLLWEGGVYNTALYCGKVRLQYSTVLWEGRTLQYSTVLWGR